jgi:sarcosine oxidase subunit delta
MRIPCPLCGIRDALEFTWGGEADVVRPQNPQACSDEAWAAYLFIRKNPRGGTYERWCHTYGCGQWFSVRRDTVTHVVEPVVDPEAAQTRRELPA